MLGFFNTLLSSREFIPHGHCYLWQTELVALHVASDLLIALSYYSIPVLLIYYVRQRRNVPFSWIFFLFGAFIIFCGTGHLLEVWTLWYPQYWLSGTLKAATAVISAYTAVELIPLLPNALALPSTTELETANAQLATELKERLRVEARLQESEQFLRSIYDGAANAIFVVDVHEDGTFCYVASNPANERMSGLKSEELRGKTPEEALPVGVGSAVRQRYESCVRAGSAISYEECFSFTGEHAWWLTTLTPLHDNDSQIYRIIGTSTQITKRKQAEAALQKLNEELEIRVEQRTAELRQANRQLLTEIADRQQVEEALRESEEKYRCVVDNVKEVIFQTDTTGLWTFLNPAWTEITGFQVDESIGTHFLNYIHPHDCQRNLELFQQLVERTIDCCRYEIRYLTINGDVRWIEVYARPIEARDGTIIGTSGTLNDVSDRRRVEEALRESEELFRRAFEDAAIGMALVDSGGRFLRVNRALCEMLGYSEPELQVITYETITHPDDLDTSLTYQSRILNGEIYRFQMEKRYIHKQGRAVWAQLTTSIVKNVRGQHIYQVSQVQDITDRKRAESEILNALAKEKELSELRSRFVSITSHEFRTPLTTILLAAELLEYYGQQWTEEEKLEQLHLIQLSVRQMTQLLDDILLIGKAEAGRMQFNPVQLDLNQLCQDLVMQMLPQAGSRQVITFANQCSINHARMDEKLLRRILSNLLSNAIKYSPPDGRIRFELTCQDGMAVFEIQDWGIGIPPKDQQHLFEFFQRASNAANIPGTGLGLAIVKKCVDLHHGQVIVFSEVGVGTTFKVSLPVNNKQETKAEL